MKTMIQQTSQPQKIQTVCGIYPFQTTHSKITMQTHQAFNGKYCSFQLVEIQLFILFIQSPHRTPRRYNAGKNTVSILGKWLNSKKFQPENITLQKRFLNVY